MVKYCKGMRTRSIDIGGCDTRKYILVVDGSDFIDNIIPKELMYK